MFRKLTGLAVVAGLFVTGTASAAITGSAHDLQSEVFGTAPTGEICIVCHAPHDNKNDAGEVLWNHAASSWDGNFTIYSSGTLDGTASQPGETSTLCLGCHDGTIAVDSYGDNTGSIKINGTNFSGLAAFGRDLGNDHPIGITYATGTGTLYDAEMKTLASSITYSNNTTGTVADLLFDNKVECASCHDVHNTVSATATKLLLIKNDVSKLCLSCHSK